MVAAADIADPAARTYDITGEATHGHTVMLTAADFAELAANRRVTVTSSAVGHSHAVTITCVSTSLRSPAACCSLRESSSARFSATRIASLPVSAVTA